jgi:hypothetical protein
VVAGSTVFVASGDGTLYALNSDHGDELWRFESGAPFSASPAIGGGRLVIGNEDGVVYCFAREPKRPRTEQEKALEKKERAMKLVPPGK